MALYDSENNRLLDTNDNVLEARAAGTIGTSLIKKQFIGDQEISKIYIGDNLVYEKPILLPQLATPTISLSGDTLSIEEVENAEYYDIYVNGVLKESVPVVSGFEVTITASGSWVNQSEGDVYIHDGQDATAPLLLTQDPANLSAYPITLNVTSGHIYILVSSKNSVLLNEQISSIDFSLNTVISSGQQLGVKGVVDKNGTININVDDFYD